MHKISNKIYLVAIVSALAMMMAGCSGGLSASSWPGVSTDGEFIYFSNATQVTALRADNGTLIWNYPEKPDNKKMFYAAPTLVDGQLLVGDYAGKVYSIDAAKGSENWVFNEGGGRIIASPSKVNETILAPSSNNHLYAMTLDGVLKWEFKAKGPLWAHVVSDGQSVFVPGMDHILYALDLDDGSEIWKTDVGGSVVSTPTFDEPKKVVYLTTLAGEVVAVNSETGEVAWKFKGDEAMWSQPVLFNDAIYLGDLTGKVYSINPVDGSVKWSITASGPIIASAAIATDGLVFVSEDGTVMGISTSGEKLWTRSITGNLFSNPVVTTDRVIVPVTKGEVLISAFDLNGNNQWSYIPEK